MLAKLTSKNQLTLPKAILEKLPGVVYFEVEAEGGRIMLNPVRVSRVDAVRSKLAELGITEQAGEDAIAWARSTK